ncbi:hypothetical protein D9M70_632610 [compost metagenome]
MNYDRLEFLDAVDELAKRVGMEIPRETNARTPQQQDDSRDQYSALDAATASSRSSWKATTRPAPTSMVAAWMLTPARASPSAMRRMAIAR